VFRGVRLGSDLVVATRKLLQNANDPFDRNVAVRPSPCNPSVAAERTNRQ
jgi:hypothetical protein